MKIKTCDACGKEGSLWKAKTKTQLGLCKSCALKNATQIGNYKITTKSSDIKPVENRTQKEDKSIPELLKLAQVVFNKWIRERDSHNGYFTCISSGKLLPISQMQAGHFYPVSTSSYLRFSEYNVHGQSINENCFNENHTVKYKENLILKIGYPKYSWLEANQHREKKWDREELLEIISKYK